MRQQTTALDVGFVGALWLASAVAYFVAGVRFDSSTFPGYIQFIDDTLLRDRLLESIWYSHAHPPLLNLVVGLALRVFGENAWTFLALFFHALGFVVAVGIFALTLRLSGARVAAYVCTMLIVLSPGFVLYQNWLMYTFLEVVLLVLSAVALYRFLDRGSTGWAVGFFSSLAALVLTRGFFHLGWFVLVAAYAIWAAQNRRLAMLACAVPLVLSSLWYVKNYFYFGAFAASTMFGLGFSNIGTLTVPRADLERLVEQGVVSPLALVSRYEQTPLLFAVPNDPPSGIPVLDLPHKSAGAFNYNFRPLVAINQQYAKDSLAVIRHYPASYVIGVMVANRLFFSPSSMNEYFSPENRAAAEPFERVFNPLLYGVAAGPRFIPQPHFGFDQPPSLEVNTSVGLIAWSGLLLVLGWLRLRPAFVGATVEDRTACITLGYVLFVLVYVYGLGTLVELGENYRYRFVAEPLFAVVTAVLATDAVRSLRARWSRPTTAVR